MTHTAPTSQNTGDLLTCIAAQLADPTIIDQSSGERTRPASLAGGAAGIALLHLERAISGNGDEAVAHRWVQAAATGGVSAGPNANLFHGTPTLALLLHTATTTLGGYQRAATALTERTIALTRERLTAATARLDAGQPLPMREFDLVHGLTGYGVYHLRRHPDHPITRDVITYLNRLTEPLTDRPDRPPWWLDSGLAGTPDPRFPNGHGNLGVAHGISAVIALLALAIRTGQHPPGTIEALAHLCSWTDQHRQPDSSSRAYWWPQYVTDPPNPAPSRHRPSWCYGTAGTARAQQLAGLALHDTVRQEHAETAMLAAIREPAWRTLLPEPGLCHGKAGLLQAAWRTAITSNSHTAAQLNRHIPDLADDLARQLATTPPDTPELMNGTAGAVLALHTAHTDTCHTDWDAFLLLS
ncbi:lanthionine synthetase C family protein [Actinoplanes sp. L3-i22]|uniref:lanthionine synthetase C family protein n=1 Tax=Actinoplanes sp. L3-i22 TaxID=2836373 RepID=UPI001C842134|nr:lanthionine synthetase C family protein [Actinoplanes sp. L3-i22]